MATKTTKKGKPANRKPAAKPANKAKSVDGITIKDVAKKVGRNQRSVRASVRRILGGGAQVGKGKRYVWRTWNDPQLKKIMKGLKSEDS